MVPISYIEGRVTIRLLRTGSPVARSPASQYRSVVCLPDLLTGALRHVGGFPVLGLLRRLCQLRAFLRTVLLLAAGDHPLLNRLSSCCAFRWGLYTGGSWGGVTLRCTATYLSVWFRQDGIPYERVCHQPRHLPAMCPGRARAYDASMASLFRSLGPILTMGAHGGPRHYGLYSPFGW